ncbi:MAG: glucose 1-dehydrogenase [Chloroflexi bacterium]|nr:glucose 1-dehydrogenase [Chloroflexota bacterium]
MCAKRLQGKVAIVTGGGSGIGRATCLLLAQEGASVVVADIAAEGGGETLKSIHHEDGKAIFVKGDVTKAADVSKIVNAALQEYGRIDILVNNVGGSRPGRTIVETAEDEWDSHLALNLKSTFLVAKHAIPRMVEAGGGSIVNVSSAAGVYGSPRNPAYCAAKGGVIALTKALAIDHAPQGIRVNCVAPSHVFTALMRRNRTPEDIERIASSNLLKRVSDPAEIAQAILFLASEDASYITGQLLVVDGGRTSHTVERREDATEARVKG